MLNEMKSRISGKKTIIIFLVMTAFLFSQSWNSTVTTSINEPNLVKMDLLTNKDGNHIIVQNSNSTNSIKYYLLNSSGTVVRSSTIETSGYAEFPNISGDNDKVYLVYKLGSNLKANYTTNAGQSWNSVTPKAIGSNTCNGVDIVFGDNGVHVVYAMKNSDPNYETYYYKLNSSNSWVDYKNVTDHSAGQYGGFTTVTVSANRVHVSFNTGTSSDPTGNYGEAKTRDKYSSNWETPQLVFGGSDGGSGSERAFSDNTSLFDFYYKFIEGMGQWHFDLYAKKRMVGGTTWSSPTLLEYDSHPGKLISPIGTNDGKTQITYLAGYPNTIYHKSFDGSSWSSAYSIATISSGYLNALSLSAVSNDLFVTFKESSSNYVKYRQYDAVPLTPTNFAGTTYNNHPKITWSPCSEPDVYSSGSIKVYRGYEDTGGFISYMLTATLGGNNTSWIDNEVALGDPRTTTKYLYKISAVDYGGKVSPTTNPIIFYGTGPLWKIGEDNNNSNIKTFSLCQNYPNPFNPTTKISYSIKEGGLVTLKVYDVLGNEVVDLVNGQKEAGTYEVEFNAANLPSGIYFYKLQSGKFTAVNKMILMR